MTRKNIKYNKNKKSNKNKKKYLIGGHSPHAIKIDGYYNNTANPEDLIETIVSNEMDRERYHKTYNVYPDESTFLGDMKELVNFDEKEIEKINYRMNPFFDSKDKGQQFIKKSRIIVVNDKKDIDKIKVAQKIFPAFINFLKLTASTKPVLKSNLKKKVSFAGGNKTLKQSAKKYNGGDGNDDELKQYREIVDNSNINNFLKQQKLNDVEKQIAIELIKGPSFFKIIMENIDPNYQNKYKNMKYDEIQTKLFKPQSITNKIVNNIPINSVKEIQIEKATKNNLQNIIDDDQKLTSEQKQNLHSLLKTDNLNDAKREYMNNLALDTKNLEMVIYEENIQNIKTIEELHQHAFDNTQLSQNDKDIIYTILNNSDTSLSNNDKLNNYYKPIGNTAIKKYEMKIYNRWGQKIYDSGLIGVSSDETIGAWDGQFMGKIAQEGCYVAIIAAFPECGAVIYEDVRFLLLR